LFGQLFFQAKGDRPLDDIIAERESKLQKKSLLFSASNTKLSSMQKVSQDFVNQKIDTRVKNRTENVVHVLEMIQLQIPTGMELSYVKFVWK